MLLASLLPWQRRRIAPQLRTVLLQQISRYRQLTGLQHIRLDGHQHIHLVPLVLDAVLDLARSESITWVRTTREPLPEGLSLRLWWRSLQTGGLIKWLVLQLLSGLAIPRLRQAGRTSDQPAFRRRVVQRIDVRNSVSALLGNGLQLNHCGSCFTACCADPPSPPQCCVGNGSAAFQQSVAFFSSTNRQKEWTSAQQL